MTGGKLLALGVIATAGGWLASEVVARRSTPTQAVEPIPAVETGVGRATARLSLSLKRLAAVRPDPYAGPVRNPFAFGASAVDPPQRAAGDPERDHSFAEPVPGAEAALQLAGVAEDPGPEGPVRRAVISAGGQVFLVGKGELVLGRYRVAGIDPGAVDLEDLEDGSVRRLVFR
ncbi:MAG TPA: hypothetical protein VK911_06700 [Vicinamibacterales bacterium]|nr:hypothetical protein [Vicinamibacterales bacterium]